MLQSKGFEITGFDPTYEGENPSVQKHYFEHGVAVQANGIVLRHVLEHIQDPISFLQGLKNANNRKGKIYIEVPCFDWICEHNIWFDIFYEHVNYFRESDFRRIFGSVIETGKLFGGQYIYVVAELGSVKEPQFDANDQVAFSIETNRSIAVHKGTEQNKVAVWGGASKGVIFALLRNRNGYPVDLIIDINPSKQGKYLPATGLLVCSPEDALAKLPESSTIFVMNSNYMHEVKGLSNNAYQYIGIDYV